MASVTRRALSRGCCLAAVLALAVVASVAAEDETTSGPSWHVVSVTAMLPSADCTPARAASNSSALSVVHRHGPCSPLLARGGEPSHAEILDRDQDRVDSIHRLTVGPRTAGQASASKGVSLPAHRGLRLGTANYIVSVGLGTPRRDLLVVFDTGSDLSWVQCKPCNNCYKQHDPLFDPSQSTTYSAVPCGAQECLDSGTCSSGKCRYEVVYGDMSQTDGNLARDTLTLGPSSDQLQGFVFGCGDDDTGLFGRADGLFGLGRDRVSLASQAAARYGAGFSYCLPSSWRAEGYLSLGSAAAPPHAQFTAMVTRSDTPSFYYLDLVGIKVAGRTVRVAPAVFKAPGTVIDSGTVITRLPSRAYSALRSSFTGFMRRYKRAPALSILDTCYDFTGRAKVQIPSVALLFDGGATLNLGFGGVLYVANRSQACLAFASNGDDTSVGILGNMQQKTFAVVYDLANQKIGFGAKGCS